MADEIHSASTSTSTAVRPPSIMLRSVRWTLPTFQPMSSSSSIITGHSPVIHSTAPSQTSHEPRRSTPLMTVDSGQAAASTRATSRMAASDTSKGSTSLNSAGLRPKTGSSRRAASAKPTASSGSSAPSIRRLPNSTLNGRFSRARESTALTRPASSRLASSSIHSPSAAALKARPSRACSSFRLKGWCMGTQRSASARR